jgi:hypothetical protein
VESLAGRGMQENEASGHVSRGCKLKCHVDSMR